MLRKHYMDVNLQYSSITMLIMLTMLWQQWYSWKQIFYCYDNRTAILQQRSTTFMQYCNLVVKYCRNVSTIFLCYMRCYVFFLAHEALLMCRKDNNWSIIGENIVSFARFFCPNCNRVFNLKRNLQWNMECGQSPSYNCPNCI